MQTKFKQFRRNGGWLGFEALESRIALTTAPMITAADTAALLQRAAAASSTTGAIIAVVDRFGNILGVREESGVLAMFNNNTPANTAANVFAIDGAVAEARTAAFFSNDDAPLTSRTVREISQSTITQRMVQSNPDLLGTPAELANSTVYGPGVVAPIGVGGHFPPGVTPTDSADLFEIELTNRDNSLTTTFGASALGAPATALGGAVTGQIYNTASYGVQSGLDMNAVTRGIGTLPGGIPLYKDGVLVGGIGVFFPGPNGYADYEQGYVPNSGQTDYQLTNSPLELLAEWIAFAAANGSSADGLFVGNLGPANDQVPPVAGYNLPGGAANQISLGGILLDEVGPNGNYVGVQTTQQTASTAGVGDPNEGLNQIVTAGQTLQVGRPGDLPQTSTSPLGTWLIPPTTGTASPSSLTAAQVSQIVFQGISQALQERAQIRLPAGVHASFVIAVADTNGKILGLYRMGDATIFSIDVAVAKARNTAYLDNPALSATDPALTAPGLPVGVAYNNRDVRFLALPNYPAGSSGPPGPYSPLNDPGVNPATGANSGSPLPASAYMGAGASLVDYVAFDPNSNFHQPGPPNNGANQNGVVFFPGSAALYLAGALIGGLGVSGDGVDQDDLDTYYALQGFAPPANITTPDEVSYKGVSLPYYVFPRNANDASNSSTISQPVILDDPQATFVNGGNNYWASYTGAGYNNEQYYIAAGDGSATATYAFSGLALGEYEVLATWPTAYNHATNTPYTFYDGSIPKGGVTVNQSVAPTANGPNGFQVLGTVNISSGILNIVISNNANNYVIADAVEVVPIAAATAPQLSVSANSLAIVPGETPESSNGTLFVATSVTRTFTIANNGAGTLALTGPTPVTVTGANAANFIVTQPPVTSLAAGASTTFQVQFSGSGALSATLTIASNDAANNGKFTFGLQGIALGPPVLLDDSQASFNGPWVSYTLSGFGYNNNQHYVPAGDGSATATYAFTGLAAGEYQISATWPIASNHATNTPYTFYDGSTAKGGVTVNQSVTPTANGPNGFQVLGTVNVSSGTLNVVISNNANNYVIADAVEIVPIPAATAPQLSVSGNSLSIVPNEAPDNANGTYFATTAVVTRTFSISNTGSGTLTLTGPTPVSVTGTNAGNFIVTQPAVTSLAAGASTTFQVQFTPSGSGTLTALVAIASNDPANSGKFAFGVQGTG